MHSIQIFILFLQNSLLAEHILSGFCRCLLFSAEFHNFIVFLRNSLCRTPCFSIELANLKIFDFIFAKGFLEIIKILFINVLPKTIHFLCAEFRIISAELYILFSQSLTISIFFFWKFKYKSAEFLVEVTVPAELYANAAEFVRDFQNLCYFCLKLDTLFKILQILLLFYAILHYF